MTLNRTSLVAALASLLLAAVCGTTAAHAAIEGGTLTVAPSPRGTVTGPSGLDCGGTCSKSYPLITHRECDPEPPRTCFIVHEPQEIVVHAEPAAGWEFAGWGGACAGAGTQDCDLVMSSDRDVSTTWNDVQNPSVAVTAPASPAAGSVDLGADAGDNDAVTKVVFFVDGAQIGEDQTPPYAVSWDSTTVADGTREVLARAFDPTGLSADATRAVTVDNTPPVVSITAGPDGQTFGPGTTQSWAFTASDATTGVAAVQCSVDGAPFGACSAADGHTVANLPDGAHTVTVRATDNVGLTGEASRSIAIDATPPATSITGGPAEGSTSTATSYAFAFASSEPGSTFACRVYPAALTPPAFGACSEAGTHAATGFSPGTYTFEVRATDAVGNVDGVGAKRTFTVAAPSGDNGAVTASGGTTGQTSAGRGAVAFALTYQVVAGRTSTRFTVLNVTGLTKAARLHVSCRGGGCPKKVKITKKGGTLRLSGLVGRPLSVGAAIDVTGTRGGLRGKVVRLTIRRTKPPRATTLCLDEGRSKPRPC